MASVEASSTSTQTTPGSDVTLATITDAGNYQLYLDASALAAGEVLIVIEELLVQAGGTYREIERGTVAVDSGNGGAYTVPRSVGYGIRYKLRQEGGSARTVPWHVMQL